MPALEESELTIDEDMMLSPDFKRSPNDQNKTRNVVLHF